MTLCRPRAMLETIMKQISSFFISVVDMVNATSLRYVEAQGYYVSPPHLMLAGLGSAGARLPSILRFASCRSSCVTFSSFLRMSGVCCACSG